MPKLLARINYHLHEWRFRFLPVTLTLAFACLLLPVCGALLAMALAPEALHNARDAAGEPIDSASFVESAWYSLLYVLDPGTIGDLASRSWGFRALMLILTVSGVVIVSVLIGLLSSRFNDRLMTEHRGRTKVVINKVTLVLGWPAEISTLLTELVLARDRRVVILAPEASRQEMEEQIHNRLDRMKRDGQRVGKIDVMCRVGDPTRPEELELVPLDGASAIIVPRPKGGDPDTRVLMTLLALINREWIGPRPPLVAVISEHENVMTAEHALGAWDGKSHVLDAEDLVARLVAQSRRFHGISVVCHDLLSFLGNQLREITVQRPQNYGAALLNYRDTVPIAVKRRATGEHPDRADRKPWVNPPASTELVPGDELIVIEKVLAGRVRWKRSPAPAMRPYGVSMTPDRDNGRTLILGRNGRIDRTLRALKGYLEPGTRIDVVGVGDEEPADATTFVAGDDRQGLDIHHWPTDPTTAGVLAAEGEDEGGRPYAQTGGERLYLDDYQHIVVLADDRANETNVDAMPLVTLMHLHRLMHGTNGRLRTQAKIICELNDGGNRQLAQRFGASDFVIGQSVVSSAAVHFVKTQYADLTDIVHELLDARDADLYFEPAGAYVPEGGVASFDDITAQASARGETAIGYRSLAHEGDFRSNYGVVVNPDKDGRDVKQLKAEGMEIIVIANRHGQPRTGDVATADQTGGRIPHSRLAG